MTEKHLTVVICTISNYASGYIISLQFSNKSNKSRSQHLIFIRDNFLPRKSHGWRSLVGYSPWGRHELVTSERLHFHFSLSHKGEGNGNPLQCSCLENPRDGRAWWAAIYGVAQSRTRLKQLSSSSNIFKVS